MLRVQSAIIALSLATAAQAQMLLQSGFEPAPFTAGLPVDGQHGWIGFFAPAAPMVADEGAAQGRQCITIAGADLEFAAPGVLAATCGAELFFDPVASGRPIVQIRADVRLDGPDTGEGPAADLASANLFVANSAGQVIGGFFVSSNGTIYAYGRAGQNYMFPTLYTGGTYAALEISLDFTAGTCAFSVDGNLIGTLILDPFGTLATTELWTAPLELAAVDDPMVLDRSLYRARFDNVSVSAKPGPRRR